MAVQQNRKTRSKRGMRRAHQHAQATMLSEDPVTGTRHRRHHISDSGFYRGERVIAEPPPKKQKVDENDTEEQG